MNLDRLLDDHENVVFIGAMRCIIESQFMDLTSTACDNSAIDSSSYLMSYDYRSQYHKKIQSWRMNF